MKEYTIAEARQIVGRTLIPLEKAILDGALWVEGVSDRTKPGRDPKHPNRRLPRDHGIDWKKVRIREDRLAWFLAHNHKRPDMLLDMLFS